MIAAHLGEELIPALAAVGMGAAPALIVVARARLTRIRNLLRRR